MASETNPPQTDSPQANPSHELDLVTIFRLGEGAVEEMEVLTVQQLLESNGISTVLVGDSPLPNLAEEIRVARGDLESAKQIIADALAAGAAGAEEAEEAAETGREGPSGK